MKYAIIEDEQIAMQNIDQMIRQLRPHYQKFFQTDTAEETIKFLMSDLKPDFLFMDIELSDANCFTIFEKVDVKVPIIFTTAYDEYAIKAFTVNSIDYLLKPISKDNLLRAIEKIESLSINTPIDYRKLGPEVFQRSKRQRILITIGDKYMYINMTDVAYFEREEKYVCAVLYNGKKYITDFLTFQRWKLSLTISTDLSSLRLLSSFTSQISENMTDVPVYLSNIQHTLP